MARQRVPMELLPIIYSSLAHELFISTLEDGIVRKIKHSKTTAGQLGNASQQKLLHVCRQGVPGIASFSSD